jgi:hypothetical protein
MGLDRLTSALILSALALCATACDDDARPSRLLDGEAAAELVPVAGSVVTRVRVVRAAFLGRRFTSCMRANERRQFTETTLVVERIGVFSQSLTFRDPGGRHLNACDGAFDDTWCGRSVARLYDGRLLDPRLDILCRDAEGRRLAYAWIEPAAGSHWIGVDQGSYTELYEVAAQLPVRIATSRGIDEDASSATFEITQYGLRGAELIRGRLEVAVAG